MPNHLTLPPASAAVRNALCLTLHWTGGNYLAAGNLSHYHGVIDGNGDLFAGIPLERNFKPLSEGYAQHTGRRNTNNIGLSVCGMWGSEQGEALEGRYGPYPLRPVSIQRMIEEAAFICANYGIPVTPQRVRVHSEWTTVAPITAQNGKWDINCIPHLDMRERRLNDGTYASANYLRAEIRQALAVLNGAKPINPGPVDEPAGSVTDTVAETSPIERAWGAFLYLLDTADGNVDQFPQAIRSKLKEIRRLAPFRSLQRPK